MIVDIEEMEALKNVYKRYGVVEEEFKSWFKDNLHIYRYFKTKDHLHHKMIYNTMAYYAFCRELPNEDCCDKCDKLPNYNTSSQFINNAREVNKTAYNRFTIEEDVNIVRHFLSTCASINKEFKHDDIIPFKDEVNLVNCFNKMSELSGRSPTSLMKRLSIYGIAHMDFRWKTKYAYRFNQTGINLIEVIKKNKKER